MNNPKKVKIYGMTGVQEVSYGAGGAPSLATDGIRLAEPAVGSIEYFYSGERSRDPATGGPSPLVPKAGKSVTMDAQVELRGAGAPYSASVLPPDFDVLAQACGMELTLDATVGLEKAIYTPGDPISAAIHAYTIQEIWRTKGVLGTMGFELSGPAVGIATAALSGFFDGVIVDDAVPDAPDIVYVAQQPPAALGATVTVGNLVVGPTSNVALRAVRFSQNLEITSRNDLGSPDGLIGFVDGIFAPTLELEIEAHSLSVTPPYHEADRIDPYILADLSTQFAVQVRWGVGGDGITYNRITLDAANAQLAAAPTVGEEGQLAIWTIPLSLASSVPGAKDNFTFTFD